MYNYAMKNTVLLVFSPSSANSNALISGVSSYARQRKWRLHMIDKADRRTLIEAIRFFDPIGCLVGGHIDKSCDPIELPTGLAKSLPVVYLDRDPFPENRQIFCVAHDSTETGRIAAKELLDLGLASYGYVAWNRPTYWNGMRLEGFTQELRADGFIPEVFSPFGGSSTARLKKMGRWLKRLPRPIGIFAANDKTAADVLLVADRIGLKVPTDLVVIGVDNNLAICTACEPSITSVAPDFERGGYLAARLLDERIANPKMPPTTRWFRPLTVQRRESTARTAIDNPSIEKAIALIHEKACEGLRAKDVIAAMPGSRRYAERNFLKATGRSILQAIIDIRLEKVKALLQKPNCNIDTIAARCGWASNNYLRRAFREHLNMSMSQWRKENVTRPIPPSNGRSRARQDKNRS